MNHLGTKVVLWASLISVALGCEGISLENGKKPCGANGLCPSGYFCLKGGDGGVDAGVTGTCWKNGTVDGGPAAGGRGGADGGKAGAAGTTDGGIDTTGATDVGFDLPASDAGGTCEGNAPCTPANACHLGKIKCVATGPTCEDTTETQSDGTPCETGKVCHAGACEACADGADCTVTGQPCKLGTNSCSTGVAVCMLSGNAPEGKACGTGLVCAMGACVACVKDATCVPTNPCHAGKLDCSTGTPTCVDQTTPLADGTSCGTDKVCSAGTCAACKVGESCAVAGNPCRTGMTTCNTGKPLCAESGNVADGTSCETGKVCKGGACLACATGTACTPTNPCHQGAIACNTGTPSCGDNGMNIAKGTTCGTDKVCNTDGACVACAAGKACTPATCKVGLTACATGASVCTVTGNAPDGSSCGSNMVCNAGVCSTCAAGTACKPAAAPCHNGTLACSTGTPVCNDATTSVADGTSCGTNLYCAGGACGACTPSQPCTPGGNVCETGTTSCATGRSVCSKTGTVADGSSCGTNKVCKTGVCVDCAAGTSCKPPTGPCHVGSLMCSTGVAVCTDTNTPLANGTSCGTNLYCSGGTCGSCTPGQACNPGGNTCQTGTYSCTTGLPVCSSVVNVANGTGCGNNKVCNGGFCMDCAANQPCNPNGNLCQTGVTSCSTGVAVCTSIVNVANGAGCGGGMVCNAGACTACAANQACFPGGNMCQTGISSCSTGTYVCTSTGNVTNGMSCGATKICTNGACVGRPNGASCSGGGECPTGNCVEGVCCDTTCTGTCKSCLLANTGVASGTCGNVKAGQAHGSDCPAAAASTCQNNGFCNGAGACQKHASGTVCGGETCPAGTTTYTPMSTCNGSGTCSGPTQSCGNYKCTSNSVRCAVSCGADTDCSTSGYCQGSSCVTKLSAGTLCSRSEQCATGPCVGRCCPTSAPCGCTQQRSSNLVKDPSFDVALSTYWMAPDGASALAARSTTDMEGCPYSGSATMSPSTSGYQFAQCIPIQGSPSTITYGGWFTRNSAATLNCYVRTYDSDNCDDNASIHQQFTNTDSPPLPDGVGGWSMVGGQLLVDQSFVTRSAMIGCASGNGTINFDHMYLSTNGTTY